MLHSWRVQSGSLVQKGETVALACRTYQSGAVTDDTADSNAKHKRPNRRRRPVPSAPASSSTSTSTSTSTSISPPSKNSSSFPSNDGFSNPIASIQQRLAEKLKATKDVTEPSIETQLSTSDESSDNKDCNFHILASATGLLRTSHDTSEAEISPLSIGYIEECSHPAFLEGICVVCGHFLSTNGNEQTDDEEQSNITNVTLPSFDSTNTDRCNKASQVTVSGGVTMTVSAEESRHLAHQDTERLLQQAKLSLVLDLDHTLVHATADPRAQQFQERDDVRTLRFPYLLEGPNNPPAAPMILKHYVKLRPHIKKFLQSVQPDYELTVYTAGTRQYAEEITIVLCRHLVGSTRDSEDLEQLRYDVHWAHEECKRLQYMNQHIRKPPSEETTASLDVDSKKRNSQNSSASEHVDETEQKSRKRKKVMFETPQSDNTQENREDEKAGVAADGRKLNSCKSKLEAFQRELADAEELEKKAWELRQKLFGSRVVSRTDVADLGRDVKSLKRIFPCGGTMAAVVDDREDVWANAADNSHDTIKGEPPRNLLLVRPYHWQPFIGFADVNNVAGDDLSGNQPGSNSESDPNVEHDVQLMWTSRILKGLHRRYYRQEAKNRKTVPELLAEMRSQVLQNATLVLSGLVPLHKKANETDKARLPIVRYAQSLGAKVRLRLFQNSFLPLFCLKFTLFFSWHCSYLIRCIDSWLTMWSLE